WSAGPVGLLFVDGDHNYGAVRADVSAWATHLAPDAVIAFDDYAATHPEVVRAVDDMVAEGILEPVEVYHDRLAVTRLASGGLEPLTTTTSEGVEPETSDPDPVATQPVPPEEFTVRAGELEGVAEGTPVEDLNVSQLRALARARGIKLGARKDRRAEMLAALRAGK